VPAAAALLAFLALLAVACSSPPAEPPEPEPWHWPPELGRPRDLALDRRTCEYDAAGFRTPHPDLYRIEVSRCLAAFGWRRGPAPPGSPPAPVHPADPIDDPADPYPEQP
jgi:hypothetical protein